MTTIFIEFNHEFLGRNLLCAIMTLFSGQIFLVIQTTPNGSFHRYVLKITLLQSMLLASFKVTDGGLGNGKEEEAGC